MSHVSQQQQQQQVQYMTPSQQAALLQEQQTNISKLQNDLAFLVNLLKQGITLICLPICLFIFMLK